MYLAYGSYAFPTGAVHIATRCEPEYSDTGLIISRKHTFSCRGTLTAASQSAMKTAILAMETALLLRNQNVILYQDDGSTSAVVLYAAGSQTGVQVAGPHYPTTEGAENATHRTFEVEFSATYGTGILPDGTGSSDLPETYAVTFEETVEFSGGEAVFTHRPNVNGLWQKQLVYPITPYVAVQSGTAVGLRGFPVVPPPMFPGALKTTKPKISRKGPRQEGTGLRDYQISWVYQFESITPLDGVPHFWVNP